MVSDAPKTREQLSDPNVWIDVRDLAEAHVLALEKEKAGGERFVIGAGSYIWQDLGQYWLDTTRVISFKAIKKN